jgi:uncharacterized protein (DUF58 family)
VTRLHALRRAPTPAEPGPGPLHEGLLRALDVSIGRRIDGLLSGDYRSSMLGDGAELAQIRPYVIGDDVRQIDWNVTARTGEPHVRVHLAERVLVTWLALDISPSMRFGTADRRKSDVAEGVAIAIGHIATRRGNRLGVVTFGGAGDRALPPRQGRAGLLGLLAAVHNRDAGTDRGQAAASRARDEKSLGADETVTGRQRKSAARLAEQLRRPTLVTGTGQAPGFAGATSFEDALRRTGAVARQRALVVLVSDFRGPLGWKRSLIDLAGRHDVIAVEIRDPREQELTDAGELWLVDAETGRQLRVDTRDAKLRTRFATAALEERARVAETFASADVRHLVLSTSGDWLRPLAAFLRRPRR